MAFNRSDTDKVYDNLIKKAVKEKGLRPVRIDQKEYNNDIDDEILSELQTSNLIISDLTYARPSVYFEAGYGEGITFSKSQEIPVIYTCRNDHFKDKPDDENGNLKVHFDLQMKNIIPWKNHTDTNFLNRLKKRINHVMKSQLQDRQKQQEDQKAIEKFKKLSSKNKIDKIFSEAILEYKKNKYNGIILQKINVDTRSIQSTYPFIYQYSINERLNIHYPETNSTWNSKLKPNILKPAWIGSKFNKGRKDSIFIVAVPSITKNIIQYFHEALFDIPIYDLNPTRKSKLKKLREFLVICSISKSKQDKIMDYLPDFSLNDNGLFFSQAKQVVPNKKLKNWKELFQITKYARFEAIIGKDKNGKLDTMNYKSDGKSLKLMYGGDAKPVVKVSEIPREMYIKIFDNITFAENFVTQNKQFLENIKNLK